MNENKTPINNGDIRRDARRPAPPQGSQGSRPAPRPQRPAIENDDAIPIRQSRPRQGQRPMGEQGQRPMGGSGEAVGGVRPPSAGPRPNAQRRVPPAAQQGERRQAPQGNPQMRNGEAPRPPQRPAGPRPPQAQAQAQPQAQAHTPAAKPNQAKTTAKPPKDADGQKSNVAEADRPISGTSSVKKDEPRKKTTLSKAGAEMMSSAVKAIIYIVAIFVVAIFLSIVIIRVGNDIFALVKSDETVDITIEEDFTINDVAQTLYDNNIISFPSLFSLYGAIKEDDGVFLAGSYTVSPSMSYDDLRAAFKPKPVTGTSWITIPEGYTVDEIIALMESYGIGTREKYIEVINEYDFDYWFVKEIPDSPDRVYRLEGYLFPDTYEFYNSSSEVTVINKLLARFNEVVVEDYINRVDELNEAYGFTTDDQKLTFDDIITIASLVEKEGGHARYYSQISSVFHNRLKNSARYPYLESDATTYYGLQVKNDGVRPEKLSAEEIKNGDTPYNSYKNKGLPPGAIANPSASAIRFALYPYVPNKAEGERDLFFFVEGVSYPYFASTIDEHNANIAKVKAEMEALSQSE